MTKHMIWKWIPLTGCIISYLNDILNEFVKQINESVVELVVNWVCPMINITPYLEPHSNLNPKVVKNAVSAGIVVVVAPIAPIVAGLNADYLWSFWLLGIFHFRRSTRRC